jgi:tetraacyldisaccharide 4'-kinase
MKTRLQKRIESIMNDRAEADHLWLKTGLLAASLAYGWGVRFREFGYTRGIFKPRRLPCAVVSIGNLTAGGTGKTPMTIHVAEFIRNLGLKTVVISRGYGGKAEKKGGIVSDGQRILMQAEMAGDEPFMMAKQLETIPVLVGSDRFQSGRTAMDRFRPDVILLDDAFQHRQLARDLDIVLMDAERPLGNGYLLPRGSLREDSASLRRCHAVVFTRADETEMPAHEHITRLLGSKPVFQSSHTPYLLKILKGKSGGTCSETAGEQGLEMLAGKRIFAFSGIARNDDFENMLESLGCSIAGTASYPDHYRYSRKDIKDIGDAAVHHGSDCMVTTEKDYFRIPSKSDFPIALAVMGVKICFKDDGFDRFVSSRLDRILHGNRSADPAERH